MFTKEVWDAIIKVFKILSGSIGATLLIGSIGLAIYGSYSLVSNPTVLITTQETSSSVIEGDTMKQTVTSIVNPVGMWISIYATIAAVTGIITLGITFASEIIKMKHTAKLEKIEADKGLVKEQIKLQSLQIPN